MEVFVGDAGEASIHQDGDDGHGNEDSRWLSSLLRRRLVLECSGEEVSVHLLACAVIC